MIIKKKVDKNLFFILPAISVLIIVLLLPIINVIVFSFFEETPKGEFIFVGLLNYINLLVNPDFPIILKNTVFFTFFSVLIHLTIGLAVALLLNRNFLFRKFVRIVAVIPWMFASVVVGITWTWMYNGQFGIINFVLKSTGLIESFIPWLSEQRTGLAAVIIASGWRGFPIIMLMILAGLQSIPQEQYEAASVDGATWYQNFIYVTIPNIRRIIAIATAIDTIWMFRHFDLIQVMTAGGPGISTEVLTTSIYKANFEFFNTGRASTISVFTFLLLLVLAIIYFRLAITNKKT